mmetsp:Transcript_17659/g.35555  ORF Transcript_17659/g.35555 Transcript_17659/m.35555 type:complete len:204 (+) Transcript_17659:127-738(+)
MHNTLSAPNICQHSTTEPPQTLTSFSHLSPDPSKHAPKICTAFIFHVPGLAWYQALPAAPRSERDGCLDAVAKSLDAAYAPATPARSWSCCCIGSGRPSCTCPQEVCRHSMRACAATPHRDSLLATQLITAPCPFWLLFLSRRARCCSAAAPASAAAAVPRAAAVQPPSSALSYWLSAIPPLLLMLAAPKPPRPALPACAPFP